MSTEDPEGATIVDSKDGRIVASHNPWFCNKVWNPRRGAYDFRGYGITAYQTLIDDCIHKVDYSHLPFGAAPTFKEANVSTLVCQLARLSLADAEVKGGTYIGREVTPTELD